MIYSMTGYAAVQRDLGPVILNLELKGVNSRYLDLGFRISEELRSFEMPLRELITTRISRGKLECRGGLNQSGGSARRLAADTVLLGQLADLQNQVRDYLPEAQALSMADILRWPGVISEPSLTAEALRAACLELMNAAIDEFLATRAREGSKLAALILERVALLRVQVAIVAPLLPKALQSYQERLAQKLRDAVANLDEERIRQELGVFAARIDVAEELNRLETHLQEIERVLERGGAVGKRLDFLMQELNREANTLASKSVSSDITAAALEMKLLIEQMREQIQNLE